MLDCKAKYGKNAEILKNTELMLKNQQKEFNNMKSKLSTQIKENEKIKNQKKKKMRMILIIITMTNQKKKIIQILTVTQVI